MSEGELTPAVGAADHSTGGAAPRITLVEYGDFQCPYCGMAYPILERIRRRMGSEMRFVFRHFPLGQIHPQARHAAEAAESAGAQGKFWAMHDALFENQGALDDASLVHYAALIGIDGEAIERDLEAGTWTKKVRDDFRSGVRSGVNGTPTFFIDGRRYDGPWADERRFREALEAAATGPSAIRADSRSASRSEPPSAGAGR